jgi:hypothetical protein
MCWKTRPGARRDFEIWSELMKLFWRQVKHELSNARDATFILAIIAGFVAWIITQLLRVVLG